MCTGVILYYQERISSKTYLQWHLRIRYDNQPIQNLQQQNEKIQQEIENQQNEETQQETELQDNDNISDAEEELPRNLRYRQQETPRTNILRDNNSQQSSEDKQTSEDEMEITHTSETWKTTTKKQIQIPQSKYILLSAKKPLTGGQAQLTTI